MQLDPYKHEVKAPSDSIGYSEGQPTAPGGARGSETRRRRLQVPQRSGNLNPADGELTAGRSSGEGGGAHGFGSAPRSRQSDRGVVGCAKPRLMLRGLERLVIGGECIGKSTNPFRFNLIVMVGSMPTMGSIEQPNVS